jgi:cyanophycinase-like exopeptidase
VAAVLVVSVSLLTSWTASAGTGTTRPGTFVPIGSDYQPPTMQRFARAAAQADTTGHVVLLVLPITYSLNAYESKSGERQRNLSLADNRRQLLEDACNAVKAPTQTCDVRLVPVLTRSDAFLDSNLAFFTNDLDGMFVLGGDQTVAMQVVADTPLERAMTAAFDRGAVFGGNSAGMAVQSTDMINGFTGENGPAQSLQQGAVDVWSSSGVNDPTRGLAFGLTTVITEQHVFELGRTGRALNVAMTTRKPVLAMDAATGGVVVDESMLTDVVGATAGVVVDPLTYNASSRFAGPRATLSERGAAFHLLPPGTWSYDITHRQPRTPTGPVAAPAVAGRAYPRLATPAGSGPLMLSSALTDDPTGTVGGRLVGLAGSGAARVVVLTVGYPRSTDAQADAKQVAAGLRSLGAASATWHVLDSRTDTSAVTRAVRDATGIVVTAPDASLVVPALAAQSTVLDAVKQRWGSGRAVLLADDAAAAALGQRVAASPPPGKDIDTPSTESVLVDNVPVVHGLGWCAGLSVEPRLLPDRRWGQLLHLAYDDHRSLAVGVDVGTALVVGNGSARVVGDSAAVVVDPRYAQFAQGSNGAMGAVWLLMDTFVDGEQLLP